MIEEKIKLAFLGDITCDRPMLKAARKGSQFDFISSLEGIKPLVSDCDVVVANLETVFGGAEKGYNPYPVSYNSPDELCEGIKAAGITLLTLANNHCLDMGGQGIDRTIETLDQHGLEHTGTVRHNSNDERYVIKTINGIRIAFVSMTDVLNLRADGNNHELSEWQQVNSLRSWGKDAAGKPIKRVIKRFLPMIIINCIRAQIKRMLSIPLVTMKTDNDPITDRDMEQIEWAISVLKEAQSKADYVVACIHSGGQFNYEPGKRSIQLFDTLEPYCDIIIGNHPHVVQKMENHNGKLRVYSLGGVNMSSSADYICHQTDFAYSGLVKITLMKGEECLIVKEIEQELVFSEESNNNYVFVRPADTNRIAQEVLRRLRNN